MGLTEASRLRLEGKGFEKLFKKHQDKWTELAEEARELIAGQVVGGKPTVDDIKKTLLPLVELDPDLREFLEEKKLTQKYWVEDFTDYLLHLVYAPQLGTPKRKKEKEK